MVISAQLAESEGARPARPFQSWAPSKSLFVTRYSFLLLVNLTLSNDTSFLCLWNGYYDIIDSVRFATVIVTKQPLLDGVTMLTYAFFTLSTPSGPLHLSYVAPSTLSQARLPRYTVHVATCTQKITRPAPFLSCFIPPAKTACYV